VLRRSLALAVSSLALAPAAHAQGGAIRYLAPAGTAQAGHTLTFHAQAPAGAVIRVSGSPRTDADGLLSADAAQDLATTAGTARASAGSMLARRPGPYWWQVYVPGGEIGPVQALTVKGAHHAQRRLYPAFGPRGHSSFYLSSAGFPATVGGPRFRAIVRAAARRWHLRARRWTSAPAGRRDGWNVAGFSTLPAGVLGLETDYTVGGRVVEQDVQFDVSAPWSDGPGYPDFDHVDLESVVLHELGHMAGIERHRAHCANSPMVAGLAGGEWWRGPDDHWFFGCAAAGAASVDGWRLERRVVAVDRG
jgi:hypothetical protein